MTLNTDLLSRVLGTIEANPSRWNQRVWHHYFDGRTTFCFAGWTVVLAEGLDPSMITPSDLRVGSIFERAADHLGLEHGVAARIFFYLNVGEANGEVRPPTFAELLHRVHAVTGYLYGAVPQSRELVDA